MFLKIPTLNVEMQVAPFLKSFFSRIIFFFGSLIFAATTFSFGATPSINPLDSIVQGSSLNPLLINGKQYTFYIRGVNGNQFLFDKNYINGSITINGIEYKNQRLNFDIHNQQLLLLFVDQFNAEKVLIVSDAWITEFSLGNSKFEVISIDGFPKKIYQSIGNGEARCFYSWKKDLKMDGSHGKSTYYFTDPLRTKYVFINGELIRFRGNNSFAKIFGKEKSKLVSKYLRDNRIKVARTNEETMERLIDFCNSLK
jgi:hypothetical protein